MIWQANPPSPRPGECEKDVVLNLQTLTLGVNWSQRMITHLNKLTACNAEANLLRNSSADVR